MRRNPLTRIEDRKDYQALFVEDESKVPSEQRVESEVQFRDLFDATQALLVGGFFLI